MSNRYDNNLLCRKVMTTVRTFHMCQEKKTTYSEPSTIAPNNSIITIRRSWSSFSAFGEIKWWPVTDQFTCNHHSAEISVIWLVEQSPIKLLILMRY